MIGLNLNRDGMFLVVLILWRLLDLFKVEFNVNLSDGNFFVKVKGFEHGNVNIHYKVDNIN